MIRKIIVINEEKCDGCGLCASACHEGAIGIVAGKAKLLREDYCDGLGDCLPACPRKAISFEHREAPAYNEAAVLENKRRKNAPDVPSCLVNFPVQIKLVPPNAPYFNGADLLIAADCTAFAYGNFHRDFMAGRICLVGCPKLDGVNYAEKLSQIFQNNDIRSITVVRMTVPCCGGLPFAVKTALQGIEKEIPVKVITITPDGKIIS
ncbi:MAG: ferredoxin [Ruminococcaceae bacterium]|nr:ferredoxin [Oscillospiraceae bacterium]